VSKEDLIKRVAEAIEAVDPSLWVGEDRASYYRRAAQAALDVIEEEAALNMPDPPRDW